MASRQEKLLKAIYKELSPDQRRLMQLIRIEPQKNNRFTFRMPIGVITLESVWETIQQVCEKEGIICKKAGMYATLEELDDILGDVEWLWRKWIPKGFVTMVVGDPGIGKSAVVLDWVRSITNCLPFPMEEKPINKSENVVWIDTEATQQILNMRSKTLGIQRDKVHIPVIDGDILSQPNIGVEEHRSQIIELVEYAKPAIVVLDSLGGSHSRGENKTEDIKPVMEFSALLARDYKTSVVIVHHLNKGRADESPEISLYRIRGSTIIPALARSIIALERSIDNTNKMRVIKSNLAVIHKDEIISVIPNMTPDDNIIGFEYRKFVPPPAKKNKKERCTEWVVAQLEKAKDGIDLTELTELGSAEGFSRQTLYSARDTMIDNIRVVGTGRKVRWQLVTLDNDNGSIEKIKKGMKNGKGKK